METKIDENKVVYARHFDAPIELVFEVWSKPEHLSHWWGPDGFTLTTQKMEFCDGGVWEFVMHGPDGTDFINKIQFIRIKKPNLIFYKQSGGGDTKDIHFQTKITLESSGEGTDLKMESIFPSKEALEKVNREYGAIEGGKQHLNNLMEYLKELKQE